MKSPIIKEILIALSLSNLLFIRSWRKLIYPTSESYHIKLEPYPMDYLGVILNVIFTASVFLLGLWVARYISNGKTPFFAKLCFLLVFGVVLNGLRHQFYDSQLGFYLNLAVLILLFIGFIFVLIKFQSNVFSLTRTAILLLSPFVLITFSQAVWGMFSANPKEEMSIEAQLSAIQPTEKPAIKSRVIWIIFDELDYFVPFEMSPSKVNLPEFERLKSTSFFATNSTSPAYTTRDSLASLITGKKVKETQTAGKNELLLTFEGSKIATKFSESPNVFSKVKELGGETGLIGWYHAYCRVIGKDLSACHWETFDTLNDFEPQPLPRILVKNFETCLISLPFGQRIFAKVDGKINEKLEDTGYVKRHFRMLDGAKAMIANPNLDLVLLHLPFPHPPNFYDGKTGEFSGGKSYLDNLILTDKVLGEFRQTLEDNNLWDNSTVIISSDHQWRINSYRGWLSKEELEITDGVEHPKIPFFLKLKGQKESVIYDKPFNTVITYDLILAIMKGEISTIEEAKTWLDNTTSNSRFQIPDSK